MFPRPKLTALMLAAVCTLGTLAHAQPGNTRVANWKDDKKSAFLLMFDDSVDTDFKNVVPELQKRGLTATFYIVPDMYQYKKNIVEWETNLPKIPGVVYGNHTLTHQGLKDYASADTDLKAVNAVILRVFPGKEPRLISFAKPGVSKDKWTITDEDYRKVLADNNLVAREIPGLAAAQFNNLTTAEGMLAIVDNGIERGTVRAILYHGVGGDWLSTPTEVLTAVLDGLVARKDKVWVTDHISAHKYQTERTTAKVNALENSDKQIRLELKSDADPKFYDGPLTLITEVPTAWKNAQITQGATKTTVPVANGHVQFDAVPGTDAITLQPAP